MISIITKIRFSSADLTLSLLECVTDTAITDHSLYSIETKNK